MLIRKRGYIAAGLALSVALAGATAEAASKKKKPNKNWIFTVGAGAFYEPVYDGSDTYKTQPFPLLAANYKDWLTISSMEGVQAKYKVNKNVYIRTGIGIDWGRDVDDDNDIKAFSSIKPTAMGQLAVGATKGDFFVEIGGGQDLLSEHKGALMALSAGIDKERIGKSKWSYKLEGTVTYANKKYMDAYYGVTGTESTLSGLAQYTPGGSLKDMGMTLTVGYAINPRTHVKTVIGGKMMLGKAKDSPLVDTVGDKANLHGGMFIAYSF